MTRPYAGAALAFLIAGQAATVTSTMELPAKGASATQANICVARDGAMIGGVASCRGPVFDVRVNCRCPDGAAPVTAPICWPGEHALKESPAVSIARRDALSQGGLLHARFQGRRFCVLYRGHAAGWNPITDAGETGPEVAPNAGAPR
jgi:hypothetical protein